MANRLNTTYEAIKAAIETLVADGHLREVDSSVLIPARDRSKAPRGSVLLSRAYRSQGNTWVGEVTILALLRARDQVQDVTDMMARLDDAIETLRAAGTAGAQIHNPTWDYWYDTTGESGAALVGVMGGVRITLRGPLLSS